MGKQKFLSMAEIQGRDLWWEAREHSRRLAEQAELEAKKRGEKTLANYLRDLLFKAVTMSLPGRPAKTQLMPTAIAQRPDVVWFVDLNKYRVRDLKPYIDAGCKAFVLRMGGPTQWVLGDHKWTIDATFRPYLEQAAKYRVTDQTIGYIVHSPFEDWSVNGATGETLHTELIDDWTAGGYMPRAFCYDHEVALCYRSTGAENWVTPVNLVTSLQENTQNTWKKYRRTVSIYTAVWFAKSRTGFWEQHDTYFYNVNKPESAGGPGTQRPLWLAWYGQTMSKTYNNMGEVSADLFTPTPEQVGKFLYIGYQGNAWQFTSALKLAGDTVGVDMSISLDNAKTFYYNFGLVEPGSTPPPPPPPPPPAGDVEARLAAVETKTAKLETFARSLPVYPV